MLISSLLIIIVIIGAILLYERFYKSRRIQVLHNLMQNKEKYTREIHGKKIIVSGGSDVLYSFDSDEMTKQLGIPVANLGTNIGFGAGFIIDFTKKQISEGDTLILSLGYALYSKPLYDVFGYEYFRMYDRKSKNKIPFKLRIKFFIKNIILNNRFEEKKFKISKSGAYKEIMGSELPSVKQIPLVFGEFQKNDVTEYLEEFKNYCEDKNIALYITFPDTLYFEEYETVEFLSELYEYLADKFNVIGKPWDFMYEINAFYNSVYHVNQTGQSKRTQNTIEFVKEENVID